MPVRQRSGSCGCQAVRKAKNYDRAPCAGPDDCADLPGRPPRPSAVRPVPHWSHIAHAQAAARKRTDSHGRGLVPACRPFGRSGGQEVKWSGDREVRRSEGREIRRSRGQVAKRSEGRKIRRSGYGESQKAGRTSFRTAPVSPPAQHSATSETLQACASSCDSQTPGTLPGTASAKSPHRKRLERKRRRPEYEKRRIVRKMPFRRTNAGRGGGRRAPSQPRSTNRRLAVRFGRRDVGTEPVGHTGRIGVHWCIRAHPAHETKKRENFPVVFNFVAEENPIFVFGGRFTRLIYDRRTGIRGTRNAYDALC